MFVENEMYLMITDLEEGDKDKINDFLKENEFESKEFASPMAMFCWEEAMYRLGAVCNPDVHRKDVDDFAKKHTDELADFLYNEDIIDSDYVSDLTDEYIAMNVESREIEEKAWNAEYLLQKKRYFDNNGIKVIK